MFSDIPSSPSCRKGAVIFIVGFKRVELSRAHNFVGLVATVFI